MSAKVSTKENSEIKVSLLIPVYNTEKYVVECLESAVKQTLKEIEIICVNDGSTDGSLALVEPYAQKYENFHLISLPKNEGLARARYHGIKAAKGEYIMVLDSDDFLEKNACEVAYKEITKRKCDVFQFGANIECEGVQDEAAVDALIKFVRPSTKTLKGKDVFEGCFSSGYYTWNLWNKIYKADLVKQIADFIPQNRCVVGEDMFIYSMISHFATSYQGKDVKLYNYRYGNGVSTKATATMKEFRSRASQIVSLNNLEAFFRAQNCFDGCRKKLVNDTKKELMHKIVWTFMFNVSEEDAPECFDLIMQNFKYEEILKILVEHNDLYVLGQRIAGSKFLKTDKKIKSIAFFYYRYGNGGVERVISCLMPKFLEMGYKVTLIVEKETKDDFLLCEGVTKVIIPKSIAINRQELLEHHEGLRKALRENEVDLLLYQASNSPHLLFDVLAAKKENCYFVTTTHDWITSTLLFDHKQFAWKPQILKCTDCVHTITHTEEKIYRDFGIKTKYIPNPLTFEHTTPPPMYDGAPNVLWVGRIDYTQKDPVAALWVIKEIRKYVPEARLTIVGKAENPGADKGFDNIISEMGLTGAVTRVGFTKNPEKYYKYASALLMTSSYEVYPMVAGEALSYGLPIVTYSMPYVEFFKNNGGVKQVPQRNTYVAAHVLIDILTDNELRAHMRDEAIKFINEVDKADVSKLWVEFFHELEQGKLQEQQPDQDVKAFLDAMTLHHYVVQDKVVYAEKVSLISNLFRYFKRFGVRATIRKAWIYMRNNGLGAAIKRGKQKLN